MAQLVSARHGRGCTAHVPQGITMPPAQEHPCDGRDLLACLPPLWRVNSAVRAAASRNLLAADKKPNSEGVQPRGKPGGRVPSELI